jgi:DNA-directed RNA polymerase specialized sigma subunit
MVSFFPIEYRATYFPDLFSVGYELVSNPVNFFSRFDESLPHITYRYPTLKSFSDRTIRNKLIPSLRSMSGQQTLGITNLGLVARSSRTQVTEALQNLGYSQTNLSQYLRIWQCFQEVRRAQRLPIDEFEMEHFQEVANRYSELYQENPIPNMNAEEVKHCLVNIGIAIRRLLDPPINSLDSFTCLANDENISLIDNLPAPQRGDEEMDQTLAAFGELIDRLLQELQTVVEKQTLFLRYGLELTQGQIGTELGNLPQYQVSRNLKRIHINIMSKICSWVQENYPIESSSPEVNGIEAVLSQYYSDRIDSFFDRAIRFLGNQSRELLRLLYIVNLSILEISNQLQISEQEVAELLTSIKQWLFQCITDNIQREIQIELPLDSIARQQISVLTETRLQTLLQLYI